MKKKLFLTTALILILATPLLVIFGPTIITDIICADSPEQLCSAAHYLWIVFGLFMLPLLAALIAIYFALRQK